MAEDVPSIAVPRMGQEFCLMDSTSDWVSRSSDSNVCLQLLLLFLAVSL